MEVPFLLSEAQMRRIEPFFPLLVGRGCAMQCDHLMASAPAAATIVQVFEKMVDALGLEPRTR